MAKGVGLYDPYNATYRALIGYQYERNEQSGQNEQSKRADESLLTSVLHVVRMAFYDTFLNSGNVNLGSQLRNIDDALLISDSANSSSSSYKPENLQAFSKEGTYWRVFLGIRSADYKDSTVIGFLTNVARFLGNTIKLVTEFPLTLIDYFVEKAFGHLMEDVLRPLLENKKFTPFMRGLVGTLLTVPIVAIGVVHTITKIAATACRLMTSPEKMWKEADDINPWLGRAARATTAGLLVAACILFPPAIAKLASALSNTAAGSTIGNSILSSIGVGLNSIGKGILWVGSSIGGAAATNVVAGAITGAVLSACVVFAKPLTEKVTSYFNSFKNDPRESEYEPLRDSYSIDRRDVPLDADTKEILERIGIGQSVVQMEATQYSDSPTEVRNNTPAANSFGQTAATQASVPQNSGVASGTQDSQDSRSIPHYH